MNDAVIYREAEISRESFIAFKGSFQISFIQPDLCKFFYFNETHSSFGMLFEVMEQFSEIGTRIRDILNLLWGFDEVFHENNMISKVLQ